jgi:hypothetical protein
MWMRLTLAFKRAAILKSRKWSERRQINASPKVSIKVVGEEANPSGLGSVG